MSNEYAIKDAEIDKDEKTNFFKNRKIIDAIIAKREKIRNFEKIDGSWMNSP